MRNSGSGAPLESVDRALLLVSMLRDGEPLTVKAAAERLGVVPSTAHRLLGALVYREFAVQDRERRYRAGPALIEQDHVLSPKTLRTAARIGLEHLHENIGETAQVMVLHQGKIRFLDGIESDALLRVGVRIGDFMPAYCSAGGKALLAELSAADLDRLYKDGLPPWPTARITTLAALKRRLASVRTSGYGTNDEETEPGVSGLGVAIRDSSGKAVAAFTVAIPTTRFHQPDIPTYVTALHEAATLTSDHLNKPSK